MCGIFGSNFKTSFFDLYNLNLSRGSFSTGIYCHSANKSITLYTKEKLSLRDIPDDMEYYFGHNRAPTGDSTFFSESTSHPFFTKNFAYAHNGIIKNTKKYENEFQNSYEVDSQWIGDFLERYTLKNTLQKVSNAPFALWVAARRTHKFYLAKTANPIYYSKSYNSFSSTSFENSKLLDDGKIYVGDTHNLHWTLETFEFSSPYFIPG